MLNSILAVPNANFVLFSLLIKAIVLSSFARFRTALIASLNYLGQPKNKT